jgi:hypothetical protein
MRMINFRKFFWFFSFNFCQNFDVRHFAMTEHMQNQIFVVGYKKKFFLHFQFGPIRWVPRRVIFENFSMCMLSICGNDFIAHWTYEEMISSHTEHMRNEFHACLASGKMWTVFTCTSMLSICGMNFIACWAYMETNLLHTEHTRKRFHRTLCIREEEFRACSASGKMWTVFTVFTCTSMLTIERISLHNEHMWNKFHR